MGGLADGHVSPGMIRCGLVPRVAPCHRFIYSRIDRLAVGHRWLPLRFIHHAIGQFALLPEQLLAAVKVFMHRHFRAPQPQSCTAGGDLQQPFTLGRHEAQLRQFPAGIVYEYQQRAVWAAPFKPVVRAAIYLNKFAKPGATFAHGVRAHRATTPGFPIAGLHHHLAGALDGQPDAVQLGEFLVGQRRAEVTVMCADQLDVHGTEGFIQPPIRGSTALLADQPGYPFLLVAIGQSAHLARGDAHLPRRLL